MRKLQIKKAVALLYIAIILLSEGVVNQGFAQERKASVTVHTPVTSLRLLVKDIARQTGSQIIVEKALAERKIVCFVDNVEETQLLKKIAKTFGADCAQRKGASGVYFELALKPEVKIWLRAYDRYRATAKKVAADYFTDRNYSQIKRSLKAAYSTENTKEDSDNATARNSADLKLVRMVTDDGWRSLARAQATGVPNFRGLLVVTGHEPLYIRSFLSMTDEGQEAMRDAIKRLPETYRDSFGKEPERFITLSFLMGVVPVVGISCPAEDGILSAGYPLDLPVQFGTSEEERSKKEWEELHRRMASQPMPTEATLGFNVDVNGVCAAPISLKPGREAATIEFSGKNATPLRSELLFQIARDQRLNLIADYYTEAKRYMGGGGGYSETLKKAAVYFHCVFLEEDGYLMSRTTDFAERDYSEAPYPIFERCIALRAQQSVNKVRKEPPPKGIPDVEPYIVTADRLLPLDLLLTVCALPQEQVMKLARYSDSRNQVGFPDILFLTGYGNSYFPEHILVGLLRDVAKDLMSAAQGVPFESLPTNLRELLRTDGEVRGGFFNKPISPDARLRLRFLPFSYWVKLQGEDADKVDEGWYLDLITPKSGERPERVICTKKILALPPAPEKPTP